MNDLVAINRICADLGITSRTLRHWEEAGLLKSVRDRQSGWRMYDADALERIRMTELLRRLALPLKDIKRVLDERTADALCEVLAEQRTRVNGARGQLEVQQAVIDDLLRVLQRRGDLSFEAVEQALSPAIVERGTLDWTKLKEMLSMNPIHDTIRQLQIVQMPPMRTVAYSHVGIEPEDTACEMVVNWIKQHGLQGTMRLFGFNTDPYPIPSSPEYGFGFCASIPEGSAIEAPLVEWRLPGGIYAKLDVPATGDPSHTWKQFHALFHSGEWGWVYDDGRSPGLEEHVPRGDEKGYQISVLVPVKKK